MQYYSRHLDQCQPCDVGWLPLFSWLVVTIMGGRLYFNILFKHQYNPLHCAKPK